MIMIRLLIYLLLAVLCVVDVWLLITSVEYLFCAFVRFQPPYVSSGKSLRSAVVAELQQHYPNAKHICEIGSGHGILAQQISRDFGGDVVALENMPFTALLCWWRGCVGRAKYKTLWCDALKFLNNTDMRFDVGVAYLGPTMSPRLIDYADRFDVLISLGFELPGIQPVRVIEGMNGFTIYAGKRYPHRIYVYEFSKNNLKHRRKR